MASPITPEVDLTTGRVLTEWFEYPEYTDEQLMEMACAHVGIDPQERPRGRIDQMAPETANLARRISAFIASKKHRKWRNGMSQQEVAHRMNEATKMIAPDNFKFLPDDVRDRTGLEINPLWMIECLVRSGVLAPKEQIAALKELAQYTHSKAPTLNQNTNINVKPEDWLLELAKEEYREVEIKQPMQPIERGSHPEYERRFAKKAAEVQALSNFAAQEFEELQSIVDAEWEEIEDDG